MQANTALQTMSTQFRTPFHINRHLYCPLRTERKQLIINQRAMIDKSKNFISNKNVTNKCIYMVGKVPLYLDLSVSK